VIRYVAAYVAAVGLAALATIIFDKLY